MFQNAALQKELDRIASGHERLMQKICARINEDMLCEIANADYGMDYDAHFKALEKIRDRTAPVGFMVWEPKEVLELFRWSEFGDNRTGRKDRSQQDFHLMRAFCCAALLEGFAQPKSHDLFDGTNATLIQLLESIEIAVGDLEADAAPFLAWMLSKFPDHEDERAFYILGLISALGRTGSWNSENTLIDALFDWMIICEQEVRKGWGGGVGRTPERWLLGTTHFNLRHKKWQALGARIKTDAGNVTDPNLRKKLTDIATRLADG